MKVYITKHVLTQGILERKVRIDRFGAAIVPDGWLSDYYRKGEWWRTFAWAHAAAEQMRLAKIKSLKKQLAKLEVMRFEEKP